MRRLALLAILLLVPVVASCGGGDGGGDGGGGQPAAEAGQTIDVSATDFKFDPSDITADPGTVTFRLTNDGESTHAIEVEGGGVEEASEEIAAGASTELTVDLQEGDYEIYCPVGNHRDLGMTGTLHVGQSHTGETETGETGTGASGSGSGY